jgi:serine/threonine-protein kinase
VIGQTISHYKILEKLGEGGMGVVYKAKDTKLDRLVAIKFLPSHIAADSDERKRFELEAKAAAALNHPNIATIYGIEEADSETFIIMEYIQGQSLREKISKGPLKIKDAVEYTIQIAEGLETAHNKDIFHRDIKSANIMIDDKNQAKIMDFGLAKLAKQSLVTKQGSTLGTAAYMSPEQARGEVVDHRTDIWSLGVVLYEMVTGRLPFKGEYEHAVIYSILNEEPEPLTALRTGVPIDLEKIVAKAMEKEPDERYQHVDEIPVDLKAITASQSSSSRKTAVKAIPSETSRFTRWKRAIPWVLIAVMAVVVVFAFWSPWRKEVPISQKVNRFTLNLPSSGPLWLTEVFQQPSLALSPDGTKLVYVVSKGGIKQLHLRELDKFEARPIPGTEDARSPFFSPDGEWIAFFTSSKLKKVSLASGALVSLCDVFPDVCSGGSWSADDVIYFSPTPSGGIVRVSASGGTPKYITALDSTRSEHGHLYPRVLPGGKAILFVVTKGGWSDNHVVALSLETGQWHTLVEAGTTPHYLPTGHLVYGLSGALLAVNFDLERLKITGSPVRLLDGIISRSGAEFSLSRSGSLAFIPGSGGWPKSELFSVNRQGQAQRLPLTPLAYSAPRLSPDGQHLAIEIASQDKGNRDIWIYNWARKSSTRLTYNPVTDNCPIWTPDGKRITFSFAQLSLPPQLSWKPADGSVEREQLCSMEYAQFPTSWSPGGRNLLFTDEHPDTKLDIWLLPMDDDRHPQSLIKTQFNETAAVFSPDGRWIAYQCDESGQMEVYVRPFPGLGSKQKISTEGGTEPVWSSDGGELFYRNGDKMMKVAVDTQPELRVSGPELLFEEWYATSRISANYDITSDGQRFLMIKGEQTTPTEIKVVLNWDEEVKRLVHK